MKSFLAMTVLFLISNFAMASGTTIGNGGSGIVCFDDNKKIISAQILDLWEGEALFNLKPVDDSRDFLKIAEQKIATLKKVNVFGDSLSSPTKLFNSFKFLPSGVPLQTTGDIDSILAVPQSCQFSQVINYSSDGTIYVNSDIWNLLDNKNRAAFIVHETIYEFLRKSSRSETNSRRARKAVAYLFSNKSLEVQNTAELSPHTYCYSSDLETEAVFYETSEKRVILEFYKVLDHRTLDRSFVLLPETFTSMNDIKSQKFHISSQVTSSIDTFEIRLFHFSTDKFEFSISLKDASANEEKQLVHLNCRDEWIF